jgi:DNA-directed RNA polymerase specialized sigma24 family protein
VERDHGPRSEDATSFHTTRWTIVMSAAQSQAPGEQSALAELCHNYWYPLYVFARHRGHSPDDAQDLTQGFFLHPVEQRALTSIDPLRGKFRSLSLASFQNDRWDQADRASRFKRGEDKEFVGLDAEKAEALNRLRHEYATQGKTSTFEALNVFLDPVNSKAPPSYEEVANRLQVSTGAVKTLIHRLRKRYTALLREEVGRTVSDPAEIDEEIPALCEALIASEGRLGP